MTSLSIYQTVSMTAPTEGAILIQQTFERCCQALCRYFTPTLHKSEAAAG